MKRFIIAACLTLSLVSPCLADPYLLMDYGHNFTTGEPSLGIEIGGTKVINDCIPLVIGLTGIWTDNSIQSSSSPMAGFFDNYLHQKRGLENGVLLKSGYTMGNLSLLIGAGWASQEYVTSGVDGIIGWRTEESKYDNYLQLYGGILYQVNKFALSAGYDNRRGIVVGIGGFFK